MLVFKIVTTEESALGKKREHNQKQKRSSYSALHHGFYTIGALLNASCLLHNNMFVPFTNFPLDMFTVRLLPNHSIAYI